MTTPPPLLPLEPKDRLSLKAERTVLLVIRSETVLFRLSELCQTVFADKRIQCVFTVPEPISLFDRKLDDAIRSVGGVVIPWESALSVDFDLAIAASPNGSVEKLCCPLIIMQHGPALSKPAAMNDTVDLVKRLENRSFPTAVAAPTDSEENNIYPDGIDVVVTGDPVFDSLAASISGRNRFREALGVGNRKLVVLSSTWGEHSLLHTHPTLVQELLANLPCNEYVVAAILHPYVWAAHGAWQIETWFHNELQAGLRIIPRDSGWQATILAADCLIGDHGSVTLYATQLGIPCMQTASSSKGAQKDHPIVVATRTSCESMNDINDALCFVKSSRKLDARTQTKPFSSVFFNDGSSCNRITALFYRYLKLEQPDLTHAPLALSAPSPITNELGLYRTAFKAPNNALTQTNFPWNIPCYPSALISPDVAYDGHLTAVESRTPAHLIPSADILLIQNEGKIPYSRVELFKRYPHAKFIMKTGKEGYALLTQNRAYRIDAPTRCGIDAVVLARAAAAMDQNGIRHCTVSMADGEIDVDLVPLSHE